MCGLGCELVVSKDQLKVGFLAFFICVCVSHVFVLQLTVINNVITFYSENFCPTFNRN